MNSSLDGKFSYEVSGVNEFHYPTPVSPLVTQSTHVVGRAEFDAENGTVDIIGKGSAAGAVADRNGNGTFAVDKDNCTAEGTIHWALPVGAPVGTPAETSHFYIVLDNSDNSDKHSANKAYHANVLVSSEAPYSSSASGSLHRFVGKFD